MQSHRSPLIVSTRALARPEPPPSLSARSDFGRTVRRLGSTRVPLLLIGEPGRGRRWVAQVLHAAADTDRPLLQLEASGQPVRGAEELPDMLARLAGGSLFVPALAQLSGPLQVTMAEHLASGGSVRLMAAVAGDPESLVHAGLLRRELVDSMFALTVPPLRDRLDDLDVVLPLLLAACATRVGSLPPPICDIARARLRAHAWPGDHSELEQFAERAIALGSLEAAVQTLAAETRPRDWPEACAHIQRGRQVELDSVRRHVVRQVERSWVDRIVTEVNGDLDEAASRLGLGARALTVKMRELGMQAPL